MITYRCDRCNREGTSKEHEKNWLLLRMGYGPNETYLEKTGDLCAKCWEELKEWLAVK